MRLLRPAVLTATLLLVLVHDGAVVAPQPLPSGGTPAPPIFPGVAPSPTDVLNQVNPQVLADGAGRVYYLWMDEAGGRGYHVRIQRSTDHGKTWPAEGRMLDQGTAQDTRSTNPAFVADGAGRVLAVWRTREQGRRHIRFLASPDAGATWPGPVKTLNRDGEGIDPLISADGQGHVYVVWDDDRGPGLKKAGTRTARGVAVFFNRSDDFGQSWLTEEVLLSGALEPATEKPDASTDGEKSARAAKGDKPERRARAKATRPRSFLSFQPRIQSDPGGRVVVAWLDTREGRTEVYVRASADHGRDWGPLTNVSRGAVDAVNHQLLADGRGRAFLVWSDGRHGREDVFFARSPDGGRSWEPPVRLSRRPVGATVSTTPSMALDQEGRVYVAWADRRNGRSDIYLNVSADGGLSWLDRDLRLDRDDAGTGISQNPHVVTYGTRGVAVLWQDDRTGFEQILLNRSADGGRTWLEREVRVDTTGRAPERGTRPRAVWEPAGILHVVWERWTGPDANAARRVEYRQVSLQP